MLSGLRSRWTTRFWWAELDGVADLAEEDQAGIDVELVVFAELGDGDAFDVLHGEIELAALGDATIKKARDVWVNEAGKNLALGAEAFTEEAGGEGQIDELDGDLLGEVSVRTVREVDGAHTAAAKKAIEGVGADALLGKRRSWLRRSCPGEFPLRRRPEAERGVRP